MTSLDLTLTEVTRFLAAPILAQEWANDQLLIWGLVALMGVALLLALMFFVSQASQWMRCFLSGAQVSVVDLIGMNLRRSPVREILSARIQGVQAGLPDHLVSVRRLEAHTLAGGDASAVVRELIKQHRSGAAPSFDQAAAEDLESIGRVGLAAGRLETPETLQGIGTAVASETIPTAGRIVVEGESLQAVAESGVVRPGETVEVIKRVGDFCIVRHQR